MDAHDAIRYRRFLSAFALVVETALLLCLLLHGDEKAAIALGISSGYFGRQRSRVLFQPQPFLVLDQSVAKRDEIIQTVGTAPGNMCLFS